MALSLMSSMSSDLMITPVQLARLIQTCPYRYKKYTIPKKTGGRRKISQPAREVKELQYWLVKNLFVKYPIHSAAAAYVKGLSIVDNADLHKRNPWLLKLDFENFFPSITAHDLKLFFLESPGRELTEKEAEVVATICTWAPQRNLEKVLAIGAPSSPILCNLLMYSFDRKISDWCAKNAIVYSRYADDIALSASSKEELKIAESFVGACVNEMRSPNLTLKETKRVIASKPFRRVVTGLVLSNDDKVSLGRDRKRLLRVKMHKFFCMKLEQSEKEELVGAMAFAKQVDPDFVNKLQKKYGDIWTKKK